ncbi:MAG: hypothetical protein J6C23_04530 [Clostridia bacterium]|nr:hypothetical protein [Clostridia bacterium]
MSEREEIRELPDKYKPMGAWGYWAWSIIYGFPIVGFIFILINCFRGDSVARRNHALSFLVTFFLVVLLIGITILILWLTGVLDMLMGYLDGWLKDLNSMITGS